MTNKFKVGDKVVAINKTRGSYNFEEFKGECKDEFLVVTGIENGNIYANAYANIENDIIYANAYAKSNIGTFWEFNTGDLIPYVESSNFKIGDKVNIKFRDLNTTGEIIGRIIGKPTYRWTNHNYS